MDNIQEKLKRPFEANEIEWRMQSGGVKNDKPWAMVLAYVTNRAIMDRLDEVFGVGGWKNEFAPTPSMDGVMCGISAKINGEWVTKYDGAPNTDIEAVKGGLSSAMKRTAVQFGIGRYLYNLSTGFANITAERNDDTLSGSVKDKQSGKNVYFNYYPPELPQFALPISHEQIKLINELIKSKGADLVKMLKFYNIDNIENTTKEVGVSMIQILNKKEDVKDENS